MPYLLQKEYRRLYSAVLPRSLLVEDGILCAEPMKRLVDEHLSGQVDHGNRLWLLLNAEVWYRMQVKNVSREQLQADLRG